MKQDQKIQIIKPLSLVTKKESADNTDTKQYNFIVQTANKQHKKKNTSKIKKHKNETTF